MEIFAAIIVGILFGCGTWLLLKKNLLWIIVGLALYSHGANLLLMQVGLLRGTEPILTEGVAASEYIDPIPQALILTAIVIGFAATAFILVLAYKIYQNVATTDMDLLRGEKG